MFNKKLESKVNRYRRGIVKVLFFPLRYIKESELKNKLRNLILKNQNSLPTEFVVNKGDIVVQVGTPWPRTMDRFRNAVGTEGRLVIFEANPYNHDTLRKHIDDNSYGNVLLIQGAVCNESGRGKLLLSPHRGDHKIDVAGVKMDNDYRKGNEDMNEVEVDFHRIDDVLDQHDIAKINYISVTVNGAELEVLKGAEQTLKRSSPYTRVYAKGHALNSDNVAINIGISSLLTEYGYKTQITRGEQSSSDDGVWNKRAGDVFAWKPL